MRVRMLMLCAGLVSAAALVGASTMGCGGCFPPSGNQKPVANNQQVLVQAPSGAFAITATANDPDNSPNPLTWTRTNPTRGTIAGFMPTVTYTPNAGFTSGSDQFTFQVNDGADASNVATIQIVMIPVGNQTPTANNMTLNVPYNQTTTIALNATDPDGPLALAAQIVTPPTNGTLGTPNGLNVAYTPTTDYVGPDSFQYTATDGAATSLTATVNLTVEISGATNRNIVLTLQNALTGQWIHYHMHLIAFREDVAVGDETRYTNFGYVRYTAGMGFGHYSFVGRDLFYYYHENGRFRSDITDSSSTVYSGIRPASSSMTPRRDDFFDNRLVPAPSLILFHDPDLLGNPPPLPFNDDRNATTINPLLATQAANIGGPCSQAGFYYVDENDQALPGTGGVFFRVPTEFQDVVCSNCAPFATTLKLTNTHACHWLHNSAVASGAGPNPAGQITNVLCYEYYLGGNVTYEFTTRAVGSTDPSLIWQVTDTPSGQIIHWFDR